MTQSPANAGAERVYARMSSAAVAPNDRLAELWPGAVAALSFSGVDIMIKLIYASGMDVITLVTARGLLGAAFMFAWLRARPAVKCVTPRQRWIALGVGLIFAGTIFGLLEAISLLPVSVAILAYFAYPLLTGIGGALTGIDRLGWPALATALVAFLGLGLMLGAEFNNLSTIGIIWALAAAGFRVASLLITRNYLHETDPRVTTWYTMASSTVLFLVAAVYVGDYHFPATALGWTSFVGVSICSTVATLLIYLSTNRIGPFRTAFIMNLEPLVTTILSIVLLGEVLTQWQTLGAAVMIISLCAFQFARAR